MLIYLTRRIYSCYKLLIICFFKYSDLPKKKIKAYELGLDCSCSKFQENSSKDKVCNLAQYIGKLQ